MYVKFTTGKWLRVGGKGKWEKIMYSRSSCFQDNANNWATRKYDNIIPHMFQAVRL